MYKTGGMNGAQTLFKIYFKIKQCYARDMTSMYPFNSEKMGRNHYNSTGLEGKQSLWATTVMV